MGGPGGVVTAEELAVLGGVGRILLHVAHAAGWFTGRRDCGSVDVICGANECKWLI